MALSTNGGVCPKFAGLSSWLSQESRVVIKVQQQDFSSFEKGRAAENHTGYIPAPEGYTLNTECHILVTSTGRLECSCYYL